MTRHRLTVLAAFLLVAPACVGRIGEPGTSAGGSGGSAAGGAGAGMEPPAPPPGEDGIIFGTSEYGLHRLTRDELDATLRDLLGITEDLTSALVPEDQVRPFAHDLASLDPTSTFIYGAAKVAEEAARRVVGSAALKSKAVPCTAQTAACLSQFTAAFGKRAYRRPLAAEETSALEKLGSDALAQATFDVAVEVLLRTFLQSPFFLYRSEIGTPSGAVAKLGAYEVGAKLSYLLVGTMPDDALMKMADDGSVLTAARRVEKARALLADPRAEAQVRRFHAEWLGYARMPHEPTVAVAYRSETDLILSDVLLVRKQPWPALFAVGTAPGVPALSSVYGVTLPANSATWTPLPPERRGLLSRAAFLSIGAKSGDTSPTARGKFIRERLLCQVILPPPPNVIADVPPPGMGGACKPERYANHRNVASCAGCHALMDPVGFGLENYDRLGKWRTQEIDAAGKPNPACVIEGKGEIVGVGTFSGAGELQDLLLAEERVERCLAQQYLRFALGHRITPAEEAMYDRLYAAYEGAGRSFSELVLAYVASDDFTVSRIGGAP